MFESLFAWLTSLSIGLLIVIGLAYLIPAVIAFLRGHQSKWAIAVLNILFGWTFIGWAIALIWSLTGVRPAEPR